MQFGPPQPRDMQNKKWTFLEDKKIRFLYSKKKFSIDKIAGFVKRSVPAISNRLTKIKVERRKPLKFKYPTEITPAVARLHAHLCGDGYLYKTREKDCYGPWAKYRNNPYRNRYFIAYANNNKHLLDEFRNDVIESFGINGKKLIKNKFRTEVRITSKKAYDFFSNLGVGDSYSWKVSTEIRKGSEAVKKNWIRAFFDDEADFDRNKNGEVSRIRVKCVNQKGLIQVAKMLERFVPCHIMPKKGFYWGNTVCININKKDVSKFLKEIGSIRCIDKFSRRSSVVRASAS